MFYADRIQETTTSTGTGNLTTAGASVGFRAFSGVVPTSTDFYLLIANTGLTDWEVTVAQLSGTTTLVRSTFICSSTGTRVSFAAGTKTVSLVQSADGVLDNDHLTDSGAHDAIQIDASDASWTFISGSDVQAALDAIDAAFGLVNPPASGSSGDVQFNNAGHMGATSDLNWTGAVLMIGGSATVTQATLDLHLNDTTDAHDASAISIVDSGNYFTSTHVEGALQELGALGGGSYTDEMAQDAIASAIAAGTHSGITITYTDASNKFDFVVTATGAPGGSNQQLQYNNSGAFGGISGSTWDGTNFILTVNGNLNLTSNASGGTSMTLGSGQAQLASDTAGLLLDHSGLIHLLNAGLDIMIPANGEFEINSDPGDAGDVFTSQGTGLPPIWAPAGGYTTEQAQDATGAMVTDGSLVYVDATPLLTRGALTGAITASQGSNTTALGSFTKSQLDTAISDGNVLYVGDVTQYTDEMVDDRVSALLVAGTNVTLTYNDAANTLTVAASGGSGTFDYGKTIAISSGTYLP